MAERRAIKSRIWDDEFFGELSFFEQLLWIALFSRLADDQGRIIDNPTLISSQVFPYKQVPADDIEMALQAFGDHIIRYEAKGRRYIQLAKWWENQPMQYAVPSNYPAPDGWDDRYRTFYKGNSIVFNWDGKDTPNSPIGSLLYEKLVSLARISSWTDYVSALNPNTNPNTNPIHTKVVKGKETAKKQPAKRSANAPSLEKAKNEFYPMAKALSDVTGEDLNLNGPKLFANAKAIVKEYTPEQITAIYSRGGLYYSHDWRGKKGERPNIAVIRETIGKLLPIMNGESNVTFAETY